MQSEAQLLATLVVGTWSTTCHHSDDTIDTNAVDGDTTLRMGDDAKRHRFHVRFLGQEKPTGTPSRHT